MVSNMISLCILYLFQYILCKQCDEVWIKSKYTEDYVLQAVSEIKVNKITQCCTVEKHGVPTSTLVDLKDLREDPG